MATQVDITVKTKIQRPRDDSDNRPISQIPECTCSISYNAQFRTEICTHFCSEWRIMGYVTGAFLDLWIRSIWWNCVWNINPSNIGLVNIQDADVVFMLSADVLTPKGARPPAGAVLTTKICFSEVSQDINDLGQKIDQFHKSQNAPVPYPTILHSEQKCTHFCSEWSIVGYGTGAFWDLWIR